MTDLVTAIERYAGWLYVLLALVMLREVLEMWRAGRQRDVSLFTLEREVATGRAVRSVVTLFLLLTVGVGVYTVANVLAPALPPETVRRAEDQVPLVDTPQLVALPSDTPTPPRTATRPPQRIVTAPPETPETPELPTTPVP